MLITVKDWLGVHKMGPTLSSAKLGLLPSDFHPHRAKELVVVSTIQIMSQLRGRPMESTSVEGKVLPASVPPLPRLMGSGQPAASLAYTLILLIKKKARCMYQRRRPD